MDLGILKEELLVAAAFDGAGHKFSTDFQAGVETTVNGGNFGIGKTARCDDMGKPCNGSHFANLRRIGQDTEYFCSRQGSIKSFLFHGNRPVPDKFHKLICMCQTEIVFQVFVAEYGMGISMNTKGTKPIIHRRGR